jgi:hypothetical protein
MVNPDFRPSLSQSINENQDPKHVADPKSGTDAKTQIQHPADVAVSTASSCTNAENQPPNSVSAPTVGTERNVQSSADDGAQKTTALSTNGNVSDVQTQPPKNDLAPVTSVPSQKTYLRNRGQIVRFISEGPPSNSTFTFPKSTTGGKNALLGPTNHYRGAIIQAREQRLGDDYGYLPIEVGDRFEVLEDRARGHKFLVKRAFGDCKRGFIKIFKVEMNPDQHRATSGTRAPASTSVTGANSAASWSEGRTTSASAEKV